MSRLLLCAAFLAACGDATPLQEEPLRITAGAREVELGKAFPLTVVRAWGRGREPDWSDDRLAPLAVRLEAKTRRKDDRRVEETRRFRAYAFAPGAWKAPVELSVRTTLDPERPGPPELPEPPPERRFPWAYALAGALVLAATVLLLRRRRTAAAPAPAPAPPAPTPAPAADALERLEALRARQPRTDAEVAALHVEASALLRAHAADRFGVDAPRMTTEELRASVANVSLDAALRACDRVKFARHRPQAEERDETLRAAIDFVKETA